MLAEKKMESIDAHRQMDSLQFKLISILRDPNYDNWPTYLKDLYNSYTWQSIEIPSKFYSLEADECTDVKKEEKNDLSKIKNELIKQRDCVANKIHMEAKNSQRSSTQKHNIILEAEGENVLLIKDCDNLRDEGKNIVQRINILEKKFKEITGVQLKNLDSIETELEKLLNEQSEIPANIKMKTPYEKIKESPKPTRVKSLMDFYGKFGNQQ